LVPVGIDFFFDIGKQVGRVLNFIKDNRWRIGLKKSPRVLSGGCPDIRRFQRNITGMFPEKVKKERGFPGLPGTGQNNGWKLRSRLEDHRLQGPLDIVGCCRNIHTLNFAF